MTLKNSQLESRTPLLAASVTLLNTKKMTPMNGEGDATKSEENMRCINNQIYREVFVKPCPTF